jgi:hypothetical protein
LVSATIEKESLGDKVLNFCIVAFTHRLRKLLALQVPQLAMILVEKQTRADAVAS